MRVKIEIEAEGTLVAIDAGGTLVVVDGVSDLEQPGDLRLGVGSDAKLTKQPSGRFTVDFETDASLQEVAAWVMRCGRRARAIEPASLVDEVVRQLTATRALYE